MNWWNQVSVVRLLIPFLAGILAAVYFPFNSYYLVPLLLGLFISFILLSETKNYKWTFRFRWIIGIMINLLFFICAVLLTNASTEIKSPWHYSKFLKDKVYVLAKLNEAPIKKVKTTKSEIQIQAVFTGKGWQQSNGKAMLYLENCDESNKLVYGDVLILFLKLTRVPPPQNPYEFNYQRFLEHHQINYQAYARKSDWKNLHQNEGNILLKSSLNLRDFLLGIFIENGVKGDEFAVGSALILGYEDKLNSEILNAYSASGALHVLSVSGLHIAIVFFVLNQLLFFIEKIKHGAKVKACILIALLWFYAALTGLSPSVLRSAAMFTLLIIGKSLNRYTNIYNTLAASMLFLLIWNPFFILDVGFQLSYLAVLGIVSMQVGIYNLWKPQSKLLDKIWTITSVSIAAQMSTFPLGLLYFHQFPNYFLISNLIVIPLSTLLLYIGMAVCAVFKIKWLVAAMCKLLTVALWLLNSAVSYFEKLPNAVIQGIGLTNLEAALIYAFLLSAFLFLKLQHIRFLKITLLSIILLVLVIGYYQTIQQTQKKMIVYHIKKHSALDFIDGNTNYFFSDSALLWNKSSLGFHVKQNWWNSGINKTYASSTKVLAMGAEAGNFKCKNFIIYFYTKKILCLRPQNAALIQNIKLSEPIDYIIVSGNSKINFAKLKKQIRFHQVIFDSSNSPQKIKFWKRQCEDNSISYFDVNQRGAFVVTL